MQRVIVVCEEYLQVEQKLKKAHRKTFVQTILQYNQNDYYYVTYPTNAIF